MIYCRHNHWVLLTAAEKGVSKAFLVSVMFAFKDVMENENKIYDKY